MDFRIDLDELGQRVLQAAGDRHGAAQRHVEIGQFLRRERGRRIDRGAGLRHHDFGQIELRLAPHQLGGELVGLARRGAVADGDQFDAMLARELCQGRERLVPAALRLVGKDRGRHLHLPGSVDHRDLHTSAEAGIETHGGARSRRRGKKQIAQVLGKHPHGLLLGRVPQPQAQIDDEMAHDPGAPGRARGLDQPAVARKPAVRDDEPMHDAPLEGAGFARRWRRRFRLDANVEHLLLLGAEQRQDAVRRQFGERLGEIEIVAELGAGFLFSLAHPRDQAAAGPHLLAQRSDQVGVLGKTLDQNGARAVERRRGIRHVLAGVDEGGSCRLRVALGTRYQEIGERHEPGLAGDLGLGAPFRPERQVDVLQPPLAVGRQDCGLERGIELPLLADRGQDHRAPLLELAQIAEPFFQRAQLRVVQRSGRLLAIARDERHRRPAVDERHGGVDLGLANAELAGDLLMDRCRHAATFRTDDHEAHMEARSAILQPPPAGVAAIPSDIAANGHCRAASLPSRPLAGRVDRPKRSEGRSGWGDYLLLRICGNTPHPIPPRRKSGGREEFAAWKVPNKTVRSRVPDPTSAPPPGAGRQAPDGTSSGRRAGRRRRAAIRMSRRRRD